MRAPFTQLYVHLVWSTWDREPLITEDICPQLYAALAQKCRQLKCEPIKISGMDDHVHMLIRVHPTIAIADLVKDIKGASSHLVTHVLSPGTSFKWQGAYGAFTVRKEDTPIVERYIQNQKKHHAGGTIELVWERSETDEF